MFVTKVDRSTYSTLRDNYIHMTLCPVYVFSKMENLLSACKHLYSVGEVCGTLYKDVSGKKLYLKTEAEHPVLSEFCAKALGDNAEYYLKEHCILVCKDAICKLGKLAN